MTPPSQPVTPEGPLTGEPTVCPATGPHVRTGYPALLARLVKRPLLPVSPPADVLHAPIPYVPYWPVLGEDKALRRLRLVVSQPALAGFAQGLPRPFTAGALRGTPGTATAAAVVARRPCLPPTSDRNTGDSCLRLPGDRAKIAASTLIGPPAGR